MMRGMLCLRRHTFCQQRQKVCKKRRQNQGFEILSAPHAGNVVIMRPTRLESFILQGGLNVVSSLRFAQSAAAAQEIAEAPPVADEARRFRGSVPVFTPQRGWKPVDTTVKAFCCCWQKVCRRRQKTLCEKETRRRQKKKSYWEHKPSETRSL